MTRERRKYLPIVTAFAAVVALAVGCDSPQSTEPLLDGPQAASVSGGNGFMVVRGEDGVDTEVSAIVDASGGKLLLSGHELWISKDAVAQPTVFTLRLEDADAIHVDLTATSYGSAVANDVGASGFLAPVTLSLSYDRAVLEGVDESRLAIGWLRPDGVVELQPSVVEANNKRVRTDLEHFSGYIIVAN